MKSPDYTDHKENNGEQEGRSFVFDKKKSGHVKIVKSEREKLEKDKIH